MQALRGREVAGRQLRRAYTAPLHLHRWTPTHCLLLIEQDPARPPHRRRRGLEKRRDLHRGAPGSTTVEGDEIRRTPPRRPHLRLHSTADRPPKQPYTIYKPWIDDPPSSRRRSGCRRPRNRRPDGERGGDDFTLQRFLRARDHNIGKASVMLLQYLAWKRTAKPHGFISDDEVHDEIAKQRVHMQGFDRLGRPVAYLFGARHFPARCDLDDFKRYVAYVLDKICTRLPVGQEKFAAAIDLKGWGYANCDIRRYVAALNIMQSYYPEWLGQVFMIHVSNMFMAAWKMVYPFIDDKTKKKFMFVADRDLDATLHDAFDESQFLEDYGRKLKRHAYENSPLSRSSR